MKKPLHLILVLVLGLTSGVIITCYLSMHASSSFLEIVRLNYQQEQHIMAIRAKRRGDMKQALMHYANLVAVTSSPGLYCFSDRREYWTIGFPIASLALEKSINESSPKSAKMQEGINRGMLAEALVEFGRTEEAMPEYIKAANLLGCDDDIIRAKEIIKEVVSFEDELLRMESQYTYPVIQ